MMDYRRIDQVLRFLRDRAVPSDFSPAEKQNLKRFSSNFTIENDVLYYRKRRVIRSVVEQHNIFLKYHCSSEGSHYGSTKTINEITKHYYWPRLSVELREKVSKCDRCTSRLPDTKYTTYEQIKATSPMEIMAIDLIGPMQETKMSNKYILTATDYFTKWVEAFPMKSKTAENVAFCLIKMFYRHGAIRSIITDQGQDFVDQVNKNFSDRLKIDHRVASIYRPLTNGLDEDSNLIIQTALKSLVNDNKDDWDHHLDEVLFDLRSSKQFPTKFSPFFLLYNREPHNPKELPAHPINENDQNSNKLATLHLVPNEEDINKFIENRTNSRSNVKTTTATVKTTADIKTIEEVKTTSERKVKPTQQKQKKKRNRSRMYQPPQPVTTDNKVLQFNTKKMRVESSLEHNYCGPFILMTVKENDVQLKNADSNHMKVWYTLDHMDLPQQQVNKPSGTISSDQPPSIPEPINDADIHENIACNEVVINFAEKS